MMAAKKQSGSDRLMKYKETPELLSEEHFTEDETATYDSSERKKVGRVSGSDEDSSQEQDSDT